MRPYCEATVLATTVVFQLVITRLLESHDIPVVHTRAQTVRLTSLTVTTLVVTGGSVTTSGSTLSTRDITTPSSSPQRPPSWFHRPLVCLDPNARSNPPVSTPQDLAETPLSVEASEVNSPSLRTTRLASASRHTTELAFPGNRTSPFRGCSHPPPHHAFCPPAPEQTWTHCRVVDTRAATDTSLPRSTSVSAISLCPWQ